MLCKLHHNLFSQREFGPPVVLTESLLHAKPGKVIAEFQGSLIAIAVHNHM